VEGYQSELSVKQAHSLHLENQLKGRNIDRYRHSISDDFFYDSIQIYIVQCACMKTRECF
jgi:hypothetical protein